MPDRPAPDRHTLARVASIAGHPLLLLPAVMMARQADRDTPIQLALLAGALLAFALLLMAYARAQVRRGRWSHIDASAVGERRRLNRGLLLALALGALVAWISGAHRDVVAILLLAASIVVAARLSARACKLSLHVAFAVFAALLALPLAWWAGIALLAFAAMIAWSRHVLGRHVPRDLVAGALAGGAAGAGFLAFAPTWQA